MAQINITAEHRHKLVDDVRGNKPTLFISMKQRNIVNEREESQQKDIIANLYIRIIVLRKAKKKKKR